MTHPRGGLNTHGRTDTRGDHTGTRARRRLAAAVIVALTGVSLAAAQGSITATVKGRVVDSGATPLPGVVVRIASVSQPSGNTQAITGLEGDYRIPLLPPANDYIIRIDYPGFAPMELGPLDLDPGKTTVQDIMLRSSDESTETIVVEALGNIIDTDSTKTASTYNAEFIEGLPIIGSSYQDILTLAPGVTDTDGDGNPNVHGARETGLQYRLDGGNITDPASGTFGQNLNAEIIEEIEIITSGATVEFGRADGGFANIITKSGGNDFEGKFALRYRTRFLNGDGADGNDLNDFDSDVPDYRDIRPSLTLGGAIVKDALWYFGSLEVRDSEVPVSQAGNTRIRTARGHYGFAKLTWQVNSFNKLSFQASSDPLEFAGNNIDVGTSPDSDYTFTQGGLTPQVKWTATISPQLLLESQATHFSAGIAVASISSRFEPIQTQRVNAGAGVIQAVYPCSAFNCDPAAGERKVYQLDLLRGTINGPFYLRTDDERIRNAIKTDLSVTVEDALGQHNIKVGIEFADEKFHDAPLTNPFLVDATRPRLSDGVPGSTGAPTTHPLAVAGSQLLTVFDPLVTEQNATSFNSSLYALDAWKPRPNLSVNGGIRLDREDIDTSGYTDFDPREERRRAIGLWKKVCHEAVNHTVLLTGGNCDALRIGDESAFDGMPPEIPDGVIPVFRDTDHDGVNDVDPDVVSLDVNGNGVLDTSGTGLGTTEEGQAFYRDLTRFTRRQTSNFSIENTNVSPRFSVSWDPWADGKTKTWATWGRYYDRLFLDTISGEIGPNSVNFLFRPDSRTHLLVPGQYSHATSTISIPQVDRGLETPYTDEWTLGIERELSAHWSGGLTWIHREGTDLLQDQDINHLTCSQNVSIGVDPYVLCGDAGLLEPDRFGATEEVFLNSPDGPIGGGAFSFGTGYRLPNGAPDLYIVNNSFNQILRIGNYNSSRYEALELKIVRRLHRSWQMQFSYTWSEAFGQADNFSTAAGNDPQTRDDEEGYLDFDQRHVLKFQAVSRLPHDITLGAAIQYDTGTPWSVTTTLVDLDNTGNTLFRTFYPGGQRNDQRNSSWWKIDGRVEKSFTMHAAAASAFLTVENLLDEDQLTIYEEDLAAADGFNLSFERDIGRRFEIGLAVSF